VIRSIVAHDRREPVAVGAGGNRSAEQLLADAALASVSLRSMRAGEVAVACADRYLLTVALLGAWSAGRAVALPPNGQDSAVRAVAELPTTAVLLHDHDGAEVGVDVRSMLGAGRPGSLTLSGVDPERHLVTLWTSGSTGAPQPHRKSAGQILGETFLLQHELAVPSGCRFLATVPSLHIYGLLFGVLLPLSSRGAFFRESPLHAEAVAAAASGFGATHLVSTPAHLRGLLVLDSLPGVKRAFSSGAPLPARVREELAERLGLAVTEIYGPTETGGIARRDEGVEAWRPFSGVTVAVDGEGRLLVDSPLLARGAARPFCVGDRASLEPGGFLLQGRADDVVKVAGKRVALAEVEARLLAVPGVTDAVAIALPVAGPRGTEILAAVAGRCVEERQVRAALLEWLDPVTLPRRIRVVDHLPRQPNGKIARGAIEALFRIEPGVLAYETVSGGAADRSFQGHFEGCPVLPGFVQLLELVLAPSKRRWPDLGVLRKVKRLKFRRTIGPGETLQVRLKRASDGPQIDFEIANGENACTSGTLDFGTTP
jgi:acyl-coenzyme A synthetase/AMP-(fatty) acid ligase